MKIKETSELARSRARFYSAVEVAVVGLLVLLGAIRVFGAEPAADPFSATVAQLWSRDPEQVRQADLKLREAGISIVPALMAAMEDDSKREVLIMRLAALRPGAYGKLLDLSADPKLAKNATFSLFQLAGPEFSDQAPRLLECVRHSPAGEHCGMALVRCMSPKAKAQTSVLVDALHDGNPRVRAYAAASLGQIGPKAGAAVESLIAALRDPAPEVRLASVVALGKIGRKARSSVPAVEAALNDADSEVRSQAKEALKNIRGS